MGGRITAVAVYEKDPCIWWAATASGGLVKTANNGITFEHQFDREATVSIGDVQVARTDPNIVWVGTGESNPRNSVSWGDGVYKSTDGGKSWKNMGLKRSFQIGRIAIHPEDPNIVYVGALGRLWGTNPERGLFKTTDGGKTWKKILHVDDRTGVIDVQMHPSHPDTLLVATYERQRDGFDTNDPAKKIAPGSGLYKTVDGGRTWQKITKGLPTCKLGRIGISYYRKNPDTVYLVVESERIGKEPENAAFAGLSGTDADAGARITRVTKGGPAEKAGLEVDDIVLSVDGKTVHSYRELLVEIRKRQAGDTAELEASRNRKSVIIKITFAKRPRPRGGRDGQRATRSRSPRTRRTRSAYSSGLGGQRENLQNQQGPKGHEYGGVYRSTDGGDSFTRINSVNPRPMYFSQIRVDPSDDRFVYVLGVPLYRSKDGGKTFTGDGGRGVHVDHHALWIDPKDGRHMILGNDGGIYVTQDRMDHWDHLNHVAIGQFYHVGLDTRRCYQVYGGLQDNGSWGGPTRVRNGRGPVNADWIRIGSGDGFTCLVDANDPDQLYYQSQNGNLGRRNLRTGERARMRPARPRASAEGRRRAAGPRESAEGRRGASGTRGSRGTRYRFNWDTPYILSKHNSRIFYAAGNYVFRSVDRGNRLTTISPEITHTDRGSATALAESPLDPGVLYVGTDDGALWVTRDEGHDWTKIYPPEQAAKPKPAATLVQKTDEDSRSKAGAAEARAKPEAEVARVAADATAGAASESKPETVAATGEAGAARPPEPSTRTGSEAARPRGARTSGRPRSGRGNRFRGRMAERLKSYDRNEDGKIERSEVPERMTRMFDRLDANQDGAIDEAELAAMASQRGRRGGRPRAPAAPGASTPAAASARDAAPAAGPARRADDPISGRWTARSTGGGFGGRRGGRGGRSGPGLVFVLALAPDGSVTGTVESGFGGGDVTEGRFDAKTGRLTFTLESRRMALDFEGTVKGDTLTGEMQAGGGRFTFGLEATREPGGDDRRGGARTRTPGAKPLKDLVPGPRWVSSIVASRYAPGRAYVTLDGHRSDDDAPHVLVTEDHGKSWRSLRANLPATAGSTRVVAEDIQSENILYLGTEFAAWVSIDRGRSWTKFNSNLPTVAVHDFAQHPTAEEIVAATHGRSLWVLNVAALRQMSAESVRERARLYRPSSAIIWRSAPSRGGTNRRFVGENPPTGVEIFYSLGRRAREVRLEITTLDGRLLRVLEASAESGLHRIVWDLRETVRRAGGSPAARFGSSRAGSRPGAARRFRRGRMVKPGVYRVALTVDGTRMTQDVAVRLDPDHPDGAWFEHQQRAELRSELEGAEEGDRP
jgi:photosystem II stability/assembly factor-like uncharacterized protein